MICFYTSSLLLVNRLAPKNQQNARHLSTLALVLLSPSLILIDHGHFQYNSVSLGLAQFAISFLISKNSRQLPVATLISGAFWFSTALNFKQVNKPMIHSYKSFHRKYSNRKINWRKFHYHLLFSFFPFEKI